jgi:hypothetical protein
MGHDRVTLVIAVAVSASIAASAAGNIKQHGRAIVQYRSDEVSAVASYEYSQRNHDGAWLLIEFAVQATERITIHRNQLTLIGPDERTIPVATHQQFLEDQQALTRLLQNALVWQHSLTPYFASRPTIRTIRFFSSPGGIIHDSAVTNPDQVAAAACCSSHRPASGMPARIASC